MSKATTPHPGDIFRPAYTFADVLLEPGFSEVLPQDVDIGIQLAPTIKLAIPILAAAMDTVSEASMAIAMAQLGGLAVIHRNLSPQQQLDEVSSVKRFEAGMVVDPITINAKAKVASAIELMRQYGISGIPVIDDQDKLVGILTNRDVRFIEDLSAPVKSIMTYKNLITVDKSITREQAKKLLHQHRIEKLLVVDARRRCTGLITVRDIERSSIYPNASKDSSGRLLAAAAIGTRANTLRHCDALVEAGCDILVVDTAHGHSSKVIDLVTQLARRHQQPLIMVGNVATPQAATALIAAGAKAIKVGIGPGSICTTRIVAGVGVPQLSAIHETAAVCRQHAIPVIADGGIRYSGDIVKALAVGAEAVMIGSLLAGSDESPGEVFIYQGRSYKSYRGMGSTGAMARGSADRYFQAELENTNKFVPEGIEGRVPYRGPVATIIHQLIGGIRAGCGYTGSANIHELRTKARMRSITSAGLTESHVHDVTITRESSNYQ